MKNKMKMYKALQKKARRLAHSTSTRDIRTFIEISNKINKLSGSMEKDIKRGL